MRLNPIDWIALALVIIGAVNWGLYGLFELDLVAEIFGELSTLSRIVYILVGISGIWLLTLAARATQTRETVRP